MSGLGFDIMVIEQNKKRELNIYGIKSKNIRKIKNFNKRRD